MGGNWKPDTIIAILKLILLINFMQQFYEFPKTAYIWLVMFRHLLTCYILHCIQLL